MYKIKDIVIQKFYKEDLTGCDQLTYIALRNICDERGIINGCHYKEIVNMIGYSEGQFYRSLNALSKKNLIEVSERNEKTVVVIGNKFNNYEVSDKYKNYCDMNLTLYDTEAYKELRAGARRILEYFVFRVLKQKYKTIQKNNVIKKQSGEKVKDNNLNSLLYKTDKYMKSEIHMYQKIKDEVFGKDGITLRMFKSYLQELKDANFISIGYGIDVNEKKYDIITVSAIMLHTPTIKATEHGVVSEKIRNSKHTHFVHFIKHLCRMFKLSFDTLNLSDVALLLIQYGKKAGEQRKNIYAVMKTAISVFARNYKELDSKIIHSLTKNIISKDYNNTLLIY